MSASTYNAAAVEDRAIRRAWAIISALERLAEREYEREQAFVGPRISDRQLRENLRAMEHEARVAALKPNGVTRGPASMESILGVAYVDRPILIEEIKP